MHIVISFIVLAAIATLICIVGSDDKSENAYVESCELVEE